MLKEDKKKYVDKKNIKEKEKRKKERMERKNASATYSTLLNCLEDTLIKLVENVDEDDPDTPRQAWEDMTCLCSTHARGDKARGLCFHSWR